MTDSTHRSIYNVSLYLGVFYLYFYAILRFYKKCHRIDVLCKTVAMFLIPAKGFPFTEVHQIVRYMQNGLVLFERTGQTLIRKPPLLFVRSIFRLNVSSECTCKDLGEFSCLILYQQYGKQTRKNLPRLGHDARLVNFVYCSHATHNQLR